MPAKTKTKKNKRTREGFCTHYVSHYGFGKSTDYVGDAWEKKHLTSESDMGTYYCARTAAESQKLYAAAEKKARDERRAEKERREAAMSTAEKAARDQKRSDQKQKREAARVKKWLKLRALNDLKAKNASQNDQVNRLAIEYDKYAASAPAFEGTPPRRACEGIGAFFTNRLDQKIVAKRYRVTVQQTAVHPRVHVQVACKETDQARAAFRTARTPVPPKTKNRKEIAGLRKKFQEHQEKVNTRASGALEEMRDWLEGEGRPLFATKNTRVDILNLAMVDLALGRLDNNVMKYCAYKMPATQDERRHLQRLAEEYDRRQMVIPTVFIMKHLFRFDRSCIVLLGQYYGYSKHQTRDNTMWLCFARSEDCDTMYAFLAGEVECALGLAPARKLTKTVRLRRGHSTGRSSRSRRS